MRGLKAQEDGPMLTLRPDADYINGDGLGSVLGERKGYRVIAFSVPQDDFLLGKRDIIKSDFAYLKGPQS